MELLHGTVTLCTGRKITGGVVRDPDGSVFVENDTESSVFTPDQIHFLDVYPALREL